MILRKKSLEKVLENNGLLRGLFPAEQTKFVDSAWNILRSFADLRLMSLASELTIARIFVVLRYGKIPKHSSLEKTMEAYFNGMKEDKGVEFLPYITEEIMTLSATSCVLRMGTDSTFKTSEKSAINLELLAEKLATQIFEHPVITENADILTLGSRRYRNRLRSVFITIDTHLTSIVPHKKFLHIPWYY